MLAQLNANNAAKADADGKVTRMLDGLDKVPSRSDSVRFVNSSRFRLFRSGPRCQPRTWKSGPSTRWRINPCTSSRTVDSTCLKLTRKRRHDQCSVLAVFLCERRPRPLLCTHLSRYCNLIASATIPLPSQSVRSRPTGVRATAFSCSLLATCPCHLLLWCHRCHSRQFSTTRITMPAQTRDDDKGACSGSYATHIEQVSDRGQASTRTRARCVDQICNAPTVQSPLPH